MPDDPRGFDVALAAWLADLRRSSGMSQEALAIQIGLSQSAVAKVESGQRSTSVREVLLWGTALGVPFAELAKGLRALWLEYVRTNSLWGGQGERAGR